MQRSPPSGPSRPFRNVLGGAFLFLLSALSQAQTALETLTALDLGVVAVVKNDQKYLISISPTGTYSFSSGILLVSSGQAGVYRLSGLTPFQPVTLELAPDFLSRQGNLGPYLGVRNGTWPTSLRADAAGSVTFPLGASIETDGSQTGYPDAAYSGAATLRVTYDTLDGIASVEHDIDVSAILRTSLTATQLEALDFGTLAAWSTNTDSASLQLSPTGAVRIATPGSAKIISFGNARPGIYQVSGGVPFAPVNISVPGEDVLLTHDRSSSSARLIANDFRLAPSTDIKLDAQGQLTFRLGATLRTEQTTAPIQDGAYSGTFSLLVEYP